MTKGFHDRFSRPLAPALAMLLVAWLAGRAGALPVAVAKAPAADSGARASAAGDSGRTAPAGSVPAPHDAVHQHSGLTPSGPKGKVPAGPRPKPLKIVVPKGGPQVQTVTLGIRHRVFPDFKEKAQATMRKPFQIGDSRYSATVTDFEPDFVIDPATHSITSRTLQLKNPAVRLIVRDHGVPSDTTWAFLNMPPHFMRKSLLAFEILRIDFVGLPPLMRDSTALGRQQP
jgi:hypothetical protein